MASHEPHVHCMRRIAELEAKLDEVRGIVEDDEYPCDEHKLELIAAALDREEGCPQWFEGYDHGHYRCHLSAGHAGICGPAPNRDPSNPPPTPHPGRSSYDGARR